MVFRYVFFISFPNPLTYFFWMHVFFDGSLTASMAFSIESAVKLCSSKTQQYMPAD